MTLPTKSTRICYQFHKPSKIFHHSSQQTSHVAQLNFMVLDLLTPAISWIFQTDFSINVDYIDLGTFHLEQNLPFKFQGWTAMAHGAHRYNLINDVLGSRIVHSILTENIHDVLFLRNKVINFMKLIRTYNEIRQNCC